MKPRLLALLAILIAPRLAFPQDAQSAAPPTAALHALDPSTPQGLQELFRYTGDTLPLVSAHRGGPRAGFPENCIATFEDTLRHTFAIMEIDPRYTKDGAIVVHHDATLERTTTGTGLLAERTLEELRALRLKDTNGVVTELTIPTLDEVLEWARGKTILVLDQKDVPTEVRVRKIEEHRAEGYAMLIVYSFKEAQTCYGLNKKIMMEVMIPDREKFEEFDRTGIPWSNVVAFVGHNPPKDKGLLRMIHARGTCCIAGTSRNLDRDFAARFASNPTELERDYRALLETGADVLETDLPCEVGALLYSKPPIPASKSRYFKMPAKR